MEYEAEDVTRIDEADNDDISRVRDFVVEDSLADSRFDELNGGAFRGDAEQVCLPGSARQRPEVAVVVFQNLQVNQPVQSRINDLIRLVSEPLDPVLGVPLDWSGCDFLQYGVQDWVARFCRVHKEQRFHIRVDAGFEGQLCKYGANHGAVQRPAWHLVEVSVLLVEEHQDELFGQA